MNQCVACSYNDRYRDKDEIISLRAGKIEGDSRTVVLIGLCRKHVKPITVFLQRTNFADEFFAEFENGWKILLDGEWCRLDRSSADLKEAEYSTWENELDGRLQLKSLLKDHS